MCEKRSGTVAAATAASKGFDFGAGAYMLVTIGETEPPPSANPFLFFNDPSNGAMRSVDRYGGIVATVAAALSKASGSPPFAVGATRVLIDTGSQATRMRKFVSLGITQMTPPSGDFCQSFVPLDGGNGKHAVEHSGPLNIAIIEGGVPT